MPKIKEELKKTVRKKKVRFYFKCNLKIAVSGISYQYEQTMAWNEVGYRIGIGKIYGQFIAMLFVLFSEQEMSKNSEKHKKSKIEV